MQFDGPTTAGNYVKSSTTTAGKAADAGTSRPVSGQILGYVLTTNSAAGTYSVVLEPDVFAGLDQLLMDGARVAFLASWFEAGLGYPFTHDDDKVKLLGAIDSQQIKAADLGMIAGTAGLNQFCFNAKDVWQGCLTRLQLTGDKKYEISEDFYVLTGSDTIAE